MMRNFEEVPFDLLAWSDAQFRVTWRRVPQRLQFSVRELGILNPLIVHETLVPGHYTMVTGWLRFQAARVDGDNAVPCHIFRGIPPKIMLLCSLFDNLGHRDLNAVEQAGALARLEEFYSREQIASSFFGVLGLTDGGRTSGDAFRRIRPLADLPEKLKWAVADRALAPDSALAFGPMAPGHVERLILLFGGLRTDAASEGEIARSFVELWTDRGVTPTEIILDEKWSWADPVVEENDEWPVAPEAVGGGFPLHVEDPYEDASRAALNALLAGMNSRDAEADLRKDSVPPTGSNTLMPEAVGRVSPQESRFFPDSPADGNRRAPGAGDAAQFRSLRKALGESGQRIDPVARTQAVLTALNRRLGRGAANIGLPARDAATRAPGLPQEAKIVRARGPRRDRNAGRLEVRFDNPEHLGTTLHQLLDAQERGELARLLSPPRR